jgi:hypothetical protein
VPPDIPWLPFSATVFIICLNIATSVLVRRTTARTREQTGLIRQLTGTLESATSQIQALQAQVPTGWTTMQNDDEVIGYVRPDYRWIIDAANRGNRDKFNEEMAKKEPEDEPPVVPVVEPTLTYRQRRPE